MQIPAFIEMRKTVCLKTVTTYLLQLLKPFLKILRLLFVNEFDGAVKAYLFKAVYNKSLNILSSKKYTEEESVEQFSDQIEALQILENNQENSLFMKELQGEIETFIETLPTQVKKVFILSRSYGLKIKEISVQLDLSPKTVEKYLTRALLELRTHLKNKDLMSLLFLLYLCSK